MRGRTAGRRKYRWLLRVQAQAPRGADPSTPHAAPAVQSRRRFLVVAYFTAIVSLFTLFGVLIIPDVVSRRDEAAPGV